MKSTETSLQNGRFITFEGIDGAGKSTHIEFVTTLLRSGGREVVVTREPGGTALGEKLRALLLNEKMHLETEALLMFAARREHIAQVIEPALSRGAWVLSDRFTDASFAYQGGGRGLSTEKLLSLENWVHPDLHPDITFLFDLPPKEASARLEASRARDRFESEKRDFFERVRAEYLRRAGEFPARFRIIDSAKSISAIEDKLREILCAWLA